MAYNYLGIMVNGIALTIGLNSVNPGHYQGWSGNLNACEADAEDMAEIAKSQKFQTSTLLTKDATRNNVINEIRKAAQTLQSGDIFMISYSGHGGQLPDKNGDEADGNDETWVLYDGQMIDDELYSLFGEFAQGTRLLAFSDSCHSGTITKVAYYSSKIDMVNTNKDSDGNVYRFIPAGAALRTYRANKDFYNKILENKDLANFKNSEKETVLLISGCQDTQLSLDGQFNGLFTSQLLRMWQDGLFEGSYHDFYKLIANRMPPTQTPNYYIYGQSNIQFEKQKPFTI